MKQLFNDSAGEKLQALTGSDIQVFQKVL